MGLVGQGWTGPTSIFMQNSSDWRWDWSDKHFHQNSLVIGDGTGPTGTFMHNSPVIGDSTGSTSIFMQNSLVIGDGADPTSIFMQNSLL